MSYRVAVRAMCEFTARAGDLDWRFTPSPTAAEGIAGHLVVQARRGADYEAEVSLSGHYADLEVRGRADGYDPALNQLEEIKTYRGPLEQQPANHRALHWAQAKVYAHLLCAARGLPQIQVALVYFSITTEQETVLTETCQAGALQVFFEQQCQRFLGWARQEAEHRSQRDQALQALEFPRPAWRSGQRELAVSVYRAAREGQCLLTEAPTGIGKTLGTLFPLLKAMPALGLDKVFFLTAKNTGHGLALEALQPVNAAAAAATQPVLRILTLQARDRLCEHPDRACHGDACPLAQGFYDRLPAARAAAVQLPLLDSQALRSTALAHRLCPYYLSQELMRWSDVIVGDYNYYFDRSAGLYALMREQQWKAGVLVDEAHNLLERARSMYSAELVQTQLTAARQSAPAVLKKPLDRLQRAWNALNKAQTSGYQSYASPPPKFSAAVQGAVSAIAELLGEQPLAPQDPLLQFFFEALRLHALLEEFGPHALLDVSLLPAGGRQVPGSRVGVRNLIPAPYLAPRFAQANSCVLFSGTLSPGHFYRDTLGLPATTAWLEVAAPFQPEQLEVQILPISTRYADRERSLAPIGKAMAAQYAAQPGNYLCFFSSFDYLQRALDWLREHHPELPLWPQTRSMDADSRAAFLQQFTEDSQGIGLAVLGGAFAEGVDLPGRRLIGAFVATLGLPQTNALNDSLLAAMRERFGAAQAYNYTYLYPGLQKVVQAAGRVIRTEHDRGTLYLMDDRFAQTRVRALLPKWWRVSIAG